MDFFLTLTALPARRMSLVGAATDGRHIMDGAHVTVGDPRVVRVTQCGGAVLQDGRRMTFSSVQHGLEREPV